MYTSALASSPVFFIYFSSLIISCTLMVGFLYTGHHAADICVQAGPSGMAFTTPRWVSLHHQHPLPWFLTHQVLFIYVHINGCLFSCVCRCALGPSSVYSACMFKPCPYQPHSCLPLACEHSRERDMEQASFSAGCRVSKYSCCGLVGVLECVAVASSLWCDKINSQGLFYDSNLNICLKCLSC